MNIEKLARHLKEFTLDEIEMIAECGCKTELEHLLNEGKIVFEQNHYKYIERNDILEYGMFAPQDNHNPQLKFKDAVVGFIENYAKKNCKQRTYETYESIFRVNIIPYFKNIFIQDISQETIIRFYKCCRRRCLGERRLKNTMALLNQLIKYYQNLGVIDKTCNFQVKRLTDKNKFSINRIIFEV